MEGKRRLGEENREGEEEGGIEGMGEQKIDQKKRRV